MVLEHGVSDDRDSLLQHIVAKLVSDQSLHNLVHTEFAAPRLVAKLPDEDLIVPEVGTLEDLINLVSSLGGFKALLDYIRRKLQLAQTHEVSSNEIQNLVVSLLIL